MYLEEEGEEETAKERKREKLGCCRRASAQQETFHSVTSGIKLSRRGDCLERRLGMERKASRGYVRRILAFGREPEEE